MKLHLSFALEFSARWYFRSYWISKSIKDTKLDLTSNLACEMHWCLHRVKLNKRIYIFVHYPLAKHFIYRVSEMKMNVCMVRSSWGICPSLCWPRSFQAVIKTAAWPIRGLASPRRNMGGPSWNTKLSLRGRCLWVQDNEWLTRRRMAGRKPHPDRQMVKEYQTDTFFFFLCKDPDESVSGRQYAAVTGINWGRIREWKRREVQREREKLTYVMKGEEE